jgi:hypothetical protein
MILVIEVETFHLETLVTLKTPSSILKFSNLPIRYGGQVLSIPYLCGFNFEFHDFSRQYLRHSWRQSALQ